MCNATIVRALMRMGYKGRMTGHGFRALAMTAIKEKLGYRHEVIDRQLAHAQLENSERLPSWGQSTNGFGSIITKRKRQKFVFPFAVLCVCACHPFECRRCSIVQTEESTHE